MNEIRISTSHGSTEKLSDTGQAHGKSEKTFGRILKESIEEVNRLQGEADKAIEDLATGETKNIHETMIAMEKAEVSFKLMLQVRNKILDAYQEVMRMGV